jgi:predicted nucleic acid-binding protein
VRRALIDTGAIYALVVRNDQHHAEAAAFTRRWVQRGGAFVLADLVFAETMTLLKSRVGSSVALRAGKELRENPVYLWKALTPEVERETWAVFQRHSDKEWSFTDCGLLVLSRFLKVPTVFAFDDHFNQMSDIRRMP